MRLISTFFSFSLSLTLFTASNQIFAQNIGIGTNSPVSKLDIKGAVTIGSGYSGSRIAPANGLIIEGNVGIGTYSPTSKLHVLSSGFGQKSIQGINSNSFGVGVVGTGGSITNPVFPQDSLYGLLEPYDPSFKYYGSVGGSFAGGVGIFSYTNAINGIGLISQHADSLGFAAYFKGNIATDGFIRNPGTKYGGSVAIHDGLTVGDLSGAGCLPNKLAICAFDSINPDFNFYGGNPSYSTPNYDNYPVCEAGFCRSVTNVEVEVTMSDWHGSPLNTEVYLRGVYLGSIISGPLQANGGQGNLAFYTETFNSSEWNGSDPYGVNWYMRFDYIGTEGDRWTEYNVTINYNYGDTSSTPSYAAFGQVRASGTLYANTSSAYGDLAEFFEVNTRNGGRIPEAGDIVSISPEEAETFSLSTQENDPYLAGVISENPSVYLNNPDKGMPIALSGRVRVKVNTKGGVIKAGDPITSSSVEGIGMKSSESGMIIGHAMQAFDGSRTDVGKIWVLLGKTHYEKAKEHVTVVQGSNINLGGVDINGSQAVNVNENEVFIPWEEKIKSRLTNKEIDFDALSVDMNPYGGYAKLLVKNVNSEGVTVSIHKKNRDKDFMGFYYSIKMIAPSLSDMDKQIVAANKGNQHDNSVFDNMTYGSRVSSAVDIYKKWNKSFNELLIESELEEEFLNTTFTIKKDEKTPFYNRMKKHAPQKYEEYISLGKSLDAAIGGDTKIMAAIHNTVRK